MNLGFDKSSFQSIAYKQIMHAVPCITYMTMHACSRRGSKAVANEEIPLKLAIKMEIIVYAKMIFLTNRVSGALEREGTRENIEI